MELCKEFRLEEICSLEKVQVEWTPAQTRYGQPVALLGSCENSSK